MELWKELLTVLVISHGIYTTIAMAVPSTGSPEVMRQEMVNATQIEQLAEPRRYCPMMIEPTPKVLHALLTGKCEHECKNDTVCPKNTKCCLDGCAFTCQRIVDHSICPPRIDYNYNNNTGVDSGTGQSGEEAEAQPVEGVDSGTGQSGGEAEAQPVEGDVRLVDGQTTNEGRLEVYVGNSWGTVCDKNFDDRLASLVCHQLGYSGTGEALEGGAFGPGSGKPLHLRNVKCHENHEGILTDCESQSGFTKRCTHNADVGIRCQGEEDRDEEVSNPVHGDVRLSNGQSSNEGRLEVYLDGSWGTVCDKNFNDDLAGLVCRQLGYNGTGQALEGGVFGPGSGKHLRNIKCDETHTGKLAECQSQSGFTKRCTHNSDVGVRCQGVIVTESPKESATNVDINDDVSRPVHGDVRLVKNGTISYEGRLEIYMENSWGTVCDKDFDDRLADLVCRQLGYNGTGVAVAGGVFGSGSGTLLRNVRCGETFDGFISECEHQTGLTDRCTHDTDVGVRCKADVVDETPDQQNTLDGNDEEVESITNTPPQNGEVRLIDGDGVSEGRLEVFLEGRWGTVCDKNFDMSLGELVCRQLGFEEVTNVLPGSTFGVAVGKPMNMRNIRCAESATVIGECEYQKGLTNRCSHNTDVGIVCSQGMTTTEMPNQNAEGDVRLTSPDGEVGSGRLEVFINGQWGTVCDVKFNIEHGNLVCRQLNFDSAAAIETNSFFGKGTGMPMHMRNVKCDATAQRIFDCEYNRGFTNRCTHDTDVGIRCQK